MVNNLANNSFINGAILHYSIISFISNVFMLREIVSCNFLSYDWVIIKYISITTATVRMIPTQVDSDQSYSAFFYAFPKFIMMHSKSS